ncbi:MAG: hypothetical protein WC839_01470 [Candidatus Paceibacterota bacterium]
MSSLTKKSLFWDTDVNNIDIIKNKRYIIERILKFGDLTDYYWLKNIYSPNEIKKVITRDRSELDKRSLNFWRYIYNINN